MEFVPGMAVEVVPQLAITAAALPLAAHIRDYRAVLILLLAKGLLTVVLSHLFASRAYRWCFSVERFARMARFGGPLVLNGLLMFAILQGDQFIVAGYYKMSDLGAYAVAASLSLAPGFMIVQVVSGVLLPLFSQVQDSEQELTGRYEAAVQVVSLGSCLLTVILIVAGEWIAVVAYGARYAGTGTLVAWMAAANAFRVIRAVPTLASLAKADTKSTLVQNSLRASGLGMALGVALQGCDLTYVAACTSVGETLAFFSAALRLRRRHKVPMRMSLQAPGMAAIFIGVSGVAVALGAHTWPWYWTTGSLLLLLAGAAVAMCTSLGALRVLVVKCMAQLVGALRAP